MDNKEGTIIGIGCLALCSLYYFYRQFSKEADNYKHRRRELHKVQAEFSKNHNQIDFVAIKEGNKRVAVILPQVRDYQMAKDTYQLRHRQIQKKYLPQVMPDGFAENQSGGRFEIKHRGQAITVDIKNCNIETGILQESKEPSIVFEENKHKEPIYYSLTYTISALNHLALYGVLKYSISENQFILEPEFILNAFKSQAQTVDNIASFWDDKIYKITFKKLVICFSMLTLGYLFIYRPLKNIWHRYKVRGEGVSEGQFDYFKNKVSFSAKTSEALKCQICKLNTISYIYQCGHLVACDDCHLKNQDNKCTICNKKSKKFMKIFI